MERSPEIALCLVCHNIDCKSRGSIEVGEAIAARLAAAGSTVEVKPYICFGACTEGPNLVLYPQGTWYSGVQPSDVPEIANHILGGSPVDRLSEGVDPDLRELILEILDSLGDL
ncbi:MAG: (2Fe-2S) ferredoxin domain-containing protein [Chloroflexi bacterium]|nr:(2Fe-2S) ferredoxin domain-containing protein [Chloroflexota bacterium]